MSQAVESMSDADVLGVLVGSRTAANLLKGTNGSLARLLNEPLHGKVVPASSGPKLRAAKELVRRSLVETMSQRDVIASPATVREYLRITLARREHEVFVGIFLDAQHRVIASEELFRGTLSQTAVYPREVVKRALAHNAAAVIFAHNHPSGVAEPSVADSMLTRSLREALSLVDVLALDHFIIAGNGVTSFAERGLM